MFRVNRHKGRRGVSPRDRLAVVQRGGVPRQKDVSLRYKAGHENVPALVFEVGKANIEFEIASLRIISSLLKDRTVWRMSGKRPIWPVSRETRAWWWDRAEAQSSAKSRARDRGLLPQAVPGRDGLTRPA